MRKPKSPAPPTATSPPCRTNHCYLSSRFGSRRGMSRRPPQVWLMPFCPLTIPFAMFRQMFEHLFIISNGFMLSFAWGWKELAIESRTSAQKYHLNHVFVTVVRTPYMASSCNIFVACNALLLTHDSRLSTSFTPPQVGGTCNTFASVTPSRTPRATSHPLARHWRGGRGVRYALHSSLLYSAAGGGGRGYM